MMIGIKAMSIITVVMAISFMVLSNLPISYDSEKQVFHFADSAAVP